MSIDEQIAEAVLRRLQPTLERIEKALASAPADDITTVPKAAKACGVHAVTVRKIYLSRLKKYRAGKTVRISISELRRLMAEETEADPDTFAAEARKGRRQ